MVRWIVLAVNAGDRIKGITYLLRVAALYNKVLLVAWDTPAPLEDYLQPAQIDWTLAGLNRTFLLKEQHAGSELFNAPMVTTHHPALAGLLNRQENVQQFRQLKVMRTQLPYKPRHRVKGSSDNDYIAQHGAVQFSRCLLKFLFKPAAKLQHDARQVLQGLYGSAEAPYMAWHWRTGGQVNEPILGRKSTTHAHDSSRLRQIMSVIACAETMPTKTKPNESVDDLLQRPVPPPSEQPLLLVTDHNLLRAFVAAGNLQRVTTMNQTVAHTRQSANYKGGTPESFHNSWVDLLLLSQADCLLYSNSGFSEVALWMSSTRCHMHLNACLAKQKAMFKGIEVRKR